LFLELGHWHRSKLGNAATPIVHMYIAALLARLDVDFSILITRLSHQRFDRIQAPTSRVGVRQDPVNVAEYGRGKPAQCEQKRWHFSRRHAVADEKPVLLGIHQAGSTQYLQMLGRVRHGHARVVREILYRTWTPRECVEQLEPTRARKRLRESRKARVDVVPSSSVFPSHRCPTQLNS
jgi:hypothetical protein